WITSVAGVRAVKALGTKISTSRPSGPGTDPDTPLSSTRSSLSWARVVSTIGDGFWLCAQIAFDAASVRATAMAAPRMNVVRSRCIPSVPRHRSSGRARRVAVHPLPAGTTMHPSEGGRQQGALEDLADPWAPPGWTVVAAADANVGVLFRLAAHVPSSGQDEGQSKERVDDGEELRHRAPATEGAPDVHEGDGGKTRSCCPE